MFYNYYRQYEMEDGLVLAVGLTGCIVVEDRGSIIKYQKKCDGCGYLVPGATMTGAGAKGSKLSSSFRCPKCGRNVKMLLQY